MLASRSFQKQVRVEIDLFESNFRRYSDDLDWNEKSLESMNKFIRIGFHCVICWVLLFNLFNSFVIRAVRLSDFSIFSVNFHFYILRVNTSLCVDSLVTIFFSFFFHIFLRSEMSFYLGKLSRYSHKLKFLSISFHA